MHELCLIHTDLKPENILLVSPEYIKVPDYKVYLVLLYLIHLPKIYLVLCLFFYCVLVAGVEKYGTDPLFSFARSHPNPQRRGPITSSCPSLVLSR